MAVLTARPLRGREQGLSSHKHPHTHVRTLSAPSHNWDPPGMGSPRHLLQLLPQKPRARIILFICFIPFLFLFWLQMKTQSVNEQPPRGKVWFGGLIWSSEENQVSVAAQEPPKRDFLKLVIPQSVPENIPRCSPETFRAQRKELCLFSFSSEQTLGWITKCHRPASPADNPLLKLIIQLKILQLGRFFSSWSFRSSSSQPNLLVTHTTPIAPDQSLKTL